MFLTIINVLATSLLVLSCILLVLVVLMQRPRQEGLGAAFGGGMADSMWGAQTTNVLQKFTVYLAFVYFGLCLLTSLVKARQHAIRVNEKGVMGQVVSPSLPTLPETLTPPPATEAPATEAPATEAPATEAPATEAPATEAPATEAPATEAPATEAPATEAPATEAPATEAPATEAPATEAPATEAPATEAPATEAPATETPQ